MSGTPTRALYASVNELTWCERFIVYVRCAGGELGPPLVDVGEFPASDWPPIVEQRAAGALERAGYRTSSRWEHHGRGMVAWIEPDLGQRA